MNPINSIVILSAMLIASSTGYAQISNSIQKEKRDTVAKRAVSYAADKFAFTRPFNVEFTNLTPYNYTSKLEGNPLPDGRINNFTQVRFNANLNFIRKKNWMLGATLGYRYTKAETDISSASEGNAFKTNGNFNYLFSSLNFSYFSNLFGKRMIYTSSLLVDGSEKHLERVKGILTGTMMLKANAKTKMTAGLVLNIDQSAQSPVIPTFSYEHKFNNRFTADIILPKSIYLRKHIFTNGRVSIGTELDGTSFYLYNIDKTPQKYEYRQIDINSGITYEHVIAKYFILSAKTGIRYSPVGRIFKKQDSFASPVVEINPEPAFFFNVGISFNPFTILGRKK